VSFACSYSFVFLLCLHKHFKGLSLSLLFVKRRRQRWLWTTNWKEYGGMRRWRIFKRKTTKNRSLIWSLYLRLCLPCYHTEQVIRSKNLNIGTYTNVQSPVLFTGNLAPVCMYRVRQKCLTILLHSCEWNRWRGEFVLERPSSETQSTSVAMERWSAEHRAFAVESYFQNNDSVVVTQRIFRRHLNIHRNDSVPSRNTVLLWVRNCRETASAAKRKCPGR